VPGDLARARIPQLQNARSARTRAQRLEGTGNLVTVLEDLNVTYEDANGAF
jgi:hypothetical protein